MTDPLQALIRAVRHESDTYLAILDEGREMELRYLIRASIHRHQKSFHCPSKFR